MFRVSAIQHSPKGEFRHESSTVFITRVGELFMAKSYFASVTKLTNLNELASLTRFVSTNATHAHVVLLLGGREEEQCSCKEDQELSSCLRIQALFPVYLLVPHTNDAMYIAHPSEREHVERFIAGTDNPLYDYVHELRFGKALLEGEPLRNVHDALEDFKRQKTTF